MKSYEDLTGAEGRKVFYRAERFPAHDLFPRRVPRAVIDGIHYELENLSMTGLAARASAVEALQRDIGSEVSVWLQQGNASLFEGKGEVRRVEPAGRNSRLALSFRGAPLSIPDLLVRHNENQLLYELNGGLGHGREEIPPEYRRHCADVMYLLRGYRAALKEVDSVSAHKDSPPDPGRLAALYGMAEERLLPEWRELWHEGNDLVRPLMGDRDRMIPVKKFTENVLTPAFMAGAVWNRSYRKPLGYPGDYGMMNYVYEWKPRGDTIYEQLVHRIGLDVAECIATRMVMIQEAIAETVAARAGKAPVRILSLGCGPAQEVANCLRAPTLPTPVEITLVDQDHEALGYAYEQVCGEVMRLDNGSAVSCLQASFAQLMRASALFAALPPQDLIYSVGLLDYLSMRRVQKLVRALFEKLAPGGQLIIGNMADVATGNQWPMEFICDWSLHYRSESELHDMAALISGAAMELRPDPTGRVYMLYVTKPDAA
jgi:SAM-dependent methyltransferase